MANLSKVHTHTHVDYQTGEITKETKVDSYKPTPEPAFVKLYLKDLILVHDLPKTCYKILLEIAKKMNFDGEIIINEYLKEKMAKSLGYKRSQTISNAITQFVSKGLLKRVGTGAYLLNPYLFAKGTWTDIAKIRAENLDLQIRYTDDGKRIINNDPKNNLPDQMSNITC